MSDAADPVESYLDALLPRLRGSSQDVRRALAESEAHLRDSTDALLARGGDYESAAHEAIARFGAVDVVAASFNRGAVPRAARRLLRPLVAAGAELAAVGFCAIGASGLGRV